MDLQTVQIFRHHSAQLRCSRVNPSGLAHVAYSGVLSRGAFSALEPMALDATYAARAFMMRTDGCVLAMSSAKGSESIRHKPDAPPGCIVTSASQVDFWKNYASALSEMGIRRVVFLDSQIVLAFRWLERRSLLRAQSGL